MMRMDGLPFPLLDTEVMLCFGWFGGIYYIYRTDEMRESRFCTYMCRILLVSSHESLGIREMFEFHENCGFIGLKGQG